MRGKGGGDYKIKYTTLKIKSKKSKTLALYITKRFKEVTKFVLSVS